jgi:O-glycosyl hydrolase
MNTALEVAKLIHADLVLSSASAWHWWLALSIWNYKDGLLYTAWRQPGDPESIIESKTLWVLGNFSRFIRPGFVRVQLTGDHHSFDSLLGSAYLDPKTGNLVLVYVNPSTDPQNVNWEFRNGNAILPQQFVPWETTENENLRAHPAINIPDGFEIPPRSVVTFVGQLGPGEH